MLDSARPSWPTVPLPAGHVATGLLLQMAHRAARCHLASALQSVEMDVRHFGILQFLVHGGLTQRQLTDLAGVDKSTLVRIIDRLEHDQLAQRTRNPHDRRSFHVTITETGRQRLAAANAAAGEIIEHLFGWLGERERCQLHQALLGIIQASRAV
ncbi:hypothetical protein CSH63_05310 [Micromonospora tulbaghiae]|uniref:HTH marR-type domain-containing protein n=1 Tax=Micromonospora tulbaghiae TaxID=479978 RepID=A0A386WF06_9ACTN|nr:MarR family transcriptional regulator [Micromonospora tulbaghiae]AYF26877.1 hypothetical protein CSH63_05310 [Micromonospora tulbaghiae]NED56958.1 MarR family transcriptional regulator [Micromonospora aurantiaca]